MEASVLHWETEFPISHSPQPAALYSHSQLGHPGESRGQGEGKGQGELSDLSLSQEVSGSRVTDSRF